MTKTLSQTLEEIAEEHDINIESSKFESITSVIENIDTQLQEMADCSHEEATVYHLYGMEKRTVEEFLLDDKENEVYEVQQGKKYLFKGECKECKKEVDVSVNVEIE